MEPSRSWIAVIAISQCLLFVTSDVKPNIVTIIADDLGWNDVGFHGSAQIPTPNIDALAYNGVILNRHYTMPTCTPSRTAYLTGKYPIRTGMQGYPLRAGEPRGLPLDEVILPQRLKELGYATHIIGKWHQGSCRTEYTPTRRGFDSFLGYWHGYNGYFNDRLIEKGKDGFNLRRDLCTSYDYVGQYATDVFTQEAVDIINRHDATQPLYLHLAHLAVHTGNDEEPFEVPDVEAAHRKFSYIGSSERRLYAEMLSILDDSVGSVVKALADRGIINNSIVLFVGDNGAQTEGQHANWGSNWPLRGLKFTLHEGGVRGVAAIWSSSFQQPGRVTNQLFHLTDWLPTLYSAAGGEVSELGEIDGIDQWPSLVNNSENSPPRIQLLINIDDFSRSEGFIKDSWKITLEGLSEVFANGYYGDVGHSPVNPPYGIGDVIASDVNMALSGINSEINGSQISPLNVDQIQSLRLQSTVNCPQKKNTEYESVICNNYCLHDIISDPCETTDLSADNSEVLTELVGILDTFRTVMVPELNRDLDPAASPELHDGIWVSWLDEKSVHSEECKI